MQKPLTKNASGLIIGGTKATITRKPYRRKEETTMKYQLTTKTADGTIIDRRSVYARDKAHLQNLKSELRDRLAWQGAARITAKREEA